MQTRWLAVAPPSPRWNERQMTFRKQSAVPTHLHPEQELEVGRLLVIYSFVLFVRACSQGEGAGGSTR